MSVRAVDSNGDWIYGIGRSAYLTGIAEIKQNIRTRLQSFLGDCFFDLGAGIDWFNFLGGKDQLSLNLAVSAVILNTQNVVAIQQLSVNLDPVTRKFTLTYAVTTSQGVVAEQNLTLPSVANLLTTEQGDPLETQGGDPILAS